MEGSVAHLPNITHDAKDSEGSQSLKRSVAAANDDGIGNSVSLL